MIHLCPDLGESTVTAYRTGRLMVVCGQQSTSLRPSQGREWACVAIMVARLAALVLIAYCLATL